MKKQRLALSMPQGFYGNVALKMWWYNIFQSEGKIFDQYRILDNVVELCRNESEHRIDIPDEVYEDFKTLYSHSEYCRDEKHNFMIYRWYRNEKGKTVRGIADGLPIPLTSLKPVAEFNDPKTNQHLVEISGFSILDGPRVSIVSTLPFSKYQEILNRTIDNLKPIASRIEGIIIDALAKANVPIPFMVTQSFFEKYGKHMGQVEDETEED